MCFSRDEKTRGKRRTNVVPATTTTINYLATRTRYTRSSAPTVPFFPAAAAVSREIVNILT